MKDLVDMLNKGCSDERLVRKIYDMRNSGELTDIIELVECATRRQNNVFEIADQISLRYFGCEIGQWHRMEENFWLRKMDASTFDAIVVYSGIENFYFAYYFEVKIEEFSPEQIETSMKACPPPDNLQGVELRQMYSVFRTIDFENAKERLSTENVKVKDIWLKKHGIMSEVES